MTVGTSYSAPACSDRPLPSYFVNFLRAAVASLCKVLPGEPGNYFYILLMPSKDLDLNPVPSPSRNGI